MAEQGATVESAKPPPDWERIEADFRTGLLSLREIAAPYDVTEGAIRKKAKQRGWTRNLAAKIKAKAEEKIQREAAQATLLTPATEAQVVEANAELVAQVAKRHQRVAKAGQELVEKLFGEIGVTTDNIELFQQLGELLCKDETTDSGRVIEDKLNKIYHAVISMDGRIDSLKKLTEAFDKLSKLERTFFRLDDETPPLPADAELTPERLTQAARYWAFRLQSAAHTSETT